jgi:hypothetical protein
VEEEDRQRREQHEELELIKSLDDLPEEVNHKSVLRSETSLSLCCLLRFCSKASCNQKSELSTKCWL